MKKTLLGRWKLVAITLGFAVILASTVYAVVTQVLRDVPAVARFVAGVELSSDNLLVTHDPGGNVAVDGNAPLAFGAIPDFDDLRLWSPFFSQCVYIHNRSNDTSLGTPTVLTVRVISDDLNSLGGGVELVQPQDCGGKPQHSDHLDRAHRTIKPGEMIRARVALHLDSSPGEGPFRFLVTFGGVGATLDGELTTTVSVLKADNKGLAARVFIPRANSWTVNVGAEQFTQLEVPGAEVAGSALGLPGDPAVPLIRRLVAIPQGAQVSVVNRSIDFGPDIININLYPVQEDAEDQSNTGDAGEVGDFGDKPFTKNANVYGLNEFLPRDPVKVEYIGRMRDLDLAMVTVAAAQYNPVSKVLRPINAATFELGFEGGTGFFLTEQALGPFESDALLLTSTAINAHILRQFVGVTIVPRICIGSELLIITDPDFRTASDELADWKRTKGITTRVVSTDTIVLATDSVANQRIKIQQYIRDQYDQCAVRLSYVLLMGDAEHIPPWYRTVWFGSTSQVAAGTDLDYALLNLNDILPDLAIGRISVDTAAEAFVVVRKTINYEKTPPASLDFYNDISMASYFQCCRNDVPQQGTTSRGFIETSEGVRNFLLNQGYNVERIYTTDDRYHDDPTKAGYYTGFKAPTRYYNTSFLPDDLRGPVTGFPWNGSKQDIIDAWNEGRFLFLHRNHGGKGGWSSPSFNTSDLSSLNNGGELPVVFSVNCASGLFDNETNGGTYNTTVGSVYWAEQALRMSGGGAVGVLGDTRNSSTWANNAITQGFFDAIWPNLNNGYGSNTSITRLADILNYGKLYMASQVGVANTTKPVASSNSNDNIVMWHAYGDPTLELWTSRPRGLFLAGYEVLGISTTQAVIGYGVEGATITAMQNGLPLGRARVVNGRADMTFITQANPNVSIELAVNIFGSTTGALAPITVIPAQIGPDLNPTAIEVSQGMQNLDNDMPLVEDRRTIVRVYVRNSSFIFNADQSNVRARLYGTRGGVSLSSSPIGASNNPITVHADGGDRRDLDDSFWFYLPSSWRSGTVTLRAEIDYLDAISESFENNNEISETVTFHDAETFNMVLVPLHIHPDGNRSNGTHIFWGTESYRWDIYNNMYRLHPSADLDMWRYEDSLKPESHSSTNEWDLRVSDDKTDMIERIWWWDSQTTDVASELHYMGGIEAAIDTDGTLGSAYTSGTDRQSWVKMWNIHDGYDDWYLKGGNSMAHELAHNEARSHVNCAGNESNPDANYPWPRPDCHIADVGDTGYFGLDVYYSKWGFSEPAVIDNDVDAFPLMGYSRPRWTSPYTWCALLNRYGVTCNLTFDGSGDTLSLSEGAAVTPDTSHGTIIDNALRVVTVTGLVKATRDQGRFINVDLRNKADILTDTVDKWKMRPAPESTTYVREVRGSSGAILHSQAVTMFNDSEEEGGALSFFELVPWASNAHGILLRGPVPLLFGRVASLNAPTVSVTQATFLTSAQNTIRLKWAGTDQDPNTNLTYDVLYSRDGGESWWALALGIAESEYLINLDLTPLPSSTQGSFRIQANDGFNTTLAGSTGPTLAIPGTPPEVTIHSPMDRSKLAAGKGLILDGTAEDNDDGQVTGTGLSWSSNVNGVLGNGEEVIIGPDILSPGTHLITLTAMDSSGMKGSQTVELFVDGTASQ